RRSRARGRRAARASGGVRDPREDVEQVARDAMRGAPDHLTGHREEPDRHLSTAEVPQLLALDPGRDQVADRDGEDGVDLAWAGTPLIRVRCHADDGRDVKARSHGLDVVETAEHADVRGVQSDLLLGLAQRGRLGIGVALVAAPARKRYLALVV